MTLRIVPTDSQNICVFDTATQKLYELPDTSNQIALSGRFFAYFETLREFIESDKQAAIIMFFCSGREVKGKRYKVTLITGSESFEFWNVEKISSGWLNHEANSRDVTAPKTGIEICYTGSAYLVYLVKESDCLNGVRVKSVKKMENKN